MRISHGTRMRKLFSSTSRAPTAPPARLGVTSRANQRRASASSLRNPHALAAEPGSSATVLVALASSFATAVGNAATRAGKVSSVPPPAMALTMPAAAAVRQSHRYTAMRLVVEEFGTVVRRLALSDHGWSRMRLRCAGTTLTTLLVRPRLGKLRQRLILGPRAFPGD